MKKTFTLLLSIIGFSTAAQAQPEINSFTVPLAGTSYTYKIASDFEQNVGDAGNQDWDFTGITYLATPTDLYSTPGSTTHGGEFPSSNLAHDDFSGTNYYNWTSTGKTWYGGYNFSNYVKYTDPIVLYTLPLSYNVATSADSYAGTKFESSDSENFNVAGTATTTYDGYGSIKTVYGTYANVVRLKTTMVETQTNTANSEVTDVTSIFYEWYTTSGVLVFAIQHITSESPSVDLEAKFIYAFNVVTTGLTEQNKGHELAASPNPATDALLIHLESLPNAGVYDIKIVNNTGDVMSSQKEFLDQIGQKSVDVSFLKEGWYVLSLSSEKTTAYYKFIKQ
ncbi:MAG: C-terminal target protein [Cytophagaceae bacterium]|jgi:hypothetical protein|nr:C-terminal target protein [Cytophagaceae bacterium]